MPELTLNTILLIVVGLVVVLGVLAMFWGTISNFLPWVKGPTINSATVNIVRAQCILKCTQDKSSICAAGGDDSWALDYDVNGDGLVDTVQCASGVINWNSGTPSDIQSLTPKMESTIWTYSCCGVAITTTTT